LQIKIIIWDQGDVMQCPFCKEEIKDGAIKCKHCGSILIPTKENLNIKEPITHTARKTIKKGNVKLYQQKRYKRLCILITIGSFIYVLVKLIIFIPANILIAFIVAIGVYIAMRIAYWIIDWINEDD
jgi:hypothetical protein